jgi:2-haloalkanoic acid dehalogenase type II
VHLSDFRVLSFDCYGTLIDWEAGLLEALRPLTLRAGVELTPDDQLARFGAHEVVLENENPTLHYSGILAQVYERLATEWGESIDAMERDRFAGSVPAWRPFPDTVEALRYLEQHYTLAILSNVDHESFAGSAAQLEIHFDYVFTAEDIGSYKPSMRNFEHLIRELRTAGYTKNQILHTAQSLFHDHVPANRAGLASAWINRRSGKDRSGATPLPYPLPHFDFEFRSLEAMADAHRADRGLPHG